MYIRVRIHKRKYAHTRAYTHLAMTDVEEGEYTHVRNIVSNLAFTEIVAKASDGQRYPLPLGWCILDVKVRGAAALKEPMTYAWLEF